MSMIAFHFASTDMNCASILRARGAETICLHMNEQDPTGQVLSHSSEILWNLLAGGCKEEATAQLSSMECVLYVSFQTWLMRTVPQNLKLIIHLNTFVFYFIITSYFLFVCALGL